jgi:hypothetical protein
MLRRDFAATSGGTLIDEEQLLREFLAPNPGLLFLPIIGDSGTGKSHLVRWLHLRLPLDPTRRIVYIPKYGTNLRSVIELILADMEGPAIAELRDELDKAVDSLDEAGAPTRLLNELSATIEDQSRLPRQLPLAPNDEYRHWLETELPKLLLDNVFRSKLLEPGGVVDRLVQEALKGKQGEDKSAPFSFTVEELPLAIADATRANRDVQDLFAQLIGSSTLRDIAVELLNESLGPAIRKLFGMGGTRLFDVMLSVRRELLAQDAELVLLIEDFTILQGIQRELLDAITEAPVRGGERVLCPIRVAMAVTTGYFQTLAETFSTRGQFAGHVYSLDVPIAQQGRGVAPDDVFDFVAGYLNAARLGQPRLEEASVDAGDERATNRRWVPNACDDCDYQDECHEAFGTSRDGFGLYPFNAAALERAVTAASPSRFDPRRILGTVVRYTLDQHRLDIRRGDFPPPAFAQHFAAAHLPPLDPDLVEDLRSLDPFEIDRRVTLLTFWGGRPTTIVNLPAGIHEAFSLPPLPDTQIEQPQRRVTTIDVGRSTSTEGTSTLPPQVQRNVSSIDQWSGGTTELDQALAGDLRRFLHAAVVARVDWNDELLLQSDDAVGPRAGKYFRQSSIDIQNARGGGPRPSSAVVLSIPATPESAALLRSVVLYQHFGHWGYDRGDERLRRLFSRLDAWAAEVVATVRRGGAEEADWDPVVAATELLVFTARVLDLPGAHSQINAELINAALSDPGASPARRGSAWDRLVDACASDNRRRVREVLLARVGARQGTGRPQAIDATSIQPAVTAFKRSWTLTPPNDAAPNEFKRLFADIDGRLREAIEDEARRLRQWHDTVAGELDAEANAADIADALARSSQAALEAGVFEPSRLRSEFEDTIRAFRRTRFSVVREIAEIVAGAESQQLGKLLSDLSASERTRPMQEIDLFRRQAATIVDASTERATQQIATLRSGGGGADEIASLDESLEKLAKVLGGDSE